MNGSLPEQRIQVLTTELQEFDPDLVEHHLKRLDLNYFNTFSLEEIRSHIHTIGELSPQQNCRIEVEQKGPKGFSFTIIGFDFPGLFSIIAGLMTIYDFTILSGTIFTYRKFRGEKEISYPLKRKKIIDYLEVEYTGNDLPPLEIDEILTRELSRYILKLKENQFLEVRNNLTKRVGNYLAHLSDEIPERLLPIDIDIEVLETCTILRITGMDTPAFLFALTNALALRGNIIHSVLIRTKGSLVNDTIAITSRDDKPITDPEYLSQLKAAAVLIKQFTQLLPLASDFDLALRHFDLFLDRVISEGTLGLQMEEFNNESVLSTLAQVFGTGDYLWEEFIRIQYSSLLPLLKNIREFRKIKRKKEMARELKGLLTGDYEESVKTLNAYKDRELFRIDIAHLIYHNRTILDLSGELSDLAEVVIEEAANLIYQDLCREYGVPGVKGEEIPFGLFALGKFGGRELGYASDLELVLIFGETGFTDHETNTISVSEFFILFVQKLRTAIKARQKGIFEIDLRLRPYGRKGQLAVSLPSWERYYSPEGNADDYERQALIRLRPITGNQRFCADLLSLRDRLLYGDFQISFEKIHDLHQKQMKVLVNPGTVNAKFSPGGLAELEYTIQKLQIQGGRDFPQLKTPNTVFAMEGLLESGILKPGEFEMLYSSYAFLRRLINALRITSGDARDLMIPSPDAEEFGFLAKRLGYLHEGEHTAGEQLSRDIQEVMEAVSRLFSTKFLPSEKKSAANGESEEKGKPGLAELLLGGQSSPEEQVQVLKGFNLRNPGSAFETLKVISAMVPDRRIFLSVIVLAERHVRSCPDPDAVFLYLERFLRNSDDPLSLLKQFLFHPVYIRLLILIFSHSDYLSTIIVNDPTLFHEAVEQENLQSEKTFEIYTRELDQICLKKKSLEGSLEALRDYRNRELLRIGIRDFHLRMPLVRITREISDVSDTLINHTWTEVLHSLGLEEMNSRQSIIALGKLGGRELNYSSDIDLIFLADDEYYQEHRADIDRANQTLITALSEQTSHGRLFRVDMRLRPYGRAGTLTGTSDFYQRYYQDTAEGWEIQAWLKARVVAGNRHLGENLIAFVHRILTDPARGKGIRMSMNRIRSIQLERLDKEGISEKEVKLGPGGIRTIEFFVQEKQVRHSAFHPDLLTGNTQAALEKLLEHSLLSPEMTRRLLRSYRFLREVEHRIQLHGLRQSHILPESGEELEKLARRCGYEDRLHDPAMKQFLEDYRVITTEVSEICL